MTRTKLGLGLEMQKTEKSSHPRREVAIASVLLRLRDGGAVSYVTFPNELEVPYMAS